MMKGELSTEHIMIYKANGYDGENYLKRNSEMQNFFSSVVEANRDVEEGGTQSHSEQTLPRLARDQRPGAKSISGTILIDSEAEESTLWAVKGKGLW